MGVARLPVVGRAAMSLKARVDRKRFSGSGDFWEEHYKDGGLSGPGSYGQLAAFKAEALNTFVRDEHIASVIEFGCGDGNQLTLADYPSYVGLDISASAIEMCRKRFAEDHSKVFHVYDPVRFDVADNSADLALSLDVIYHLVEDSVFERHLEHLFGSATRFVAIYSSDEAIPSQLPFVRHRKFTADVERRFPDWELQRVIENPYPWSGNVDTGSHADFFFFGRAPS